jgi:hypothetical protein
MVWCGWFGDGWDGLLVVDRANTGLSGDNESVQFRVRFTRSLLAIGVFTDTLVGVRPVVRPTTHNYCVWNAACCSAGCATPSDVMLCSAGCATPSDVMLCALPPPDLVRWGGQAHGGRLLACLLCAAIASWCQKQDRQTASKPRRDWAARLGRRRPPAAGVLCRVILRVPCCARVNERWRGGARGVRDGWMRV